MVENGTVGLGLATAHHEEIKTGCRYVELIRLHILVNCMELRWRQPCSDPVAACKFTKSNEKESQIRSFTSLQIVLTHTLCSFSCALRPVVTARPHDQRPLRLAWHHVFPSLMQS